MWQGGKENRLSFCKQHWSSVAIGCKTHAEREITVSAPAPAGSKLRLLSVCLAALLASCAAPGAPALRNANAVDADLLVPDCQNIAPNVRVTRLRTSSYFTTWGSVYAEIGQQAQTDIPRLVGQEAAGRVRDPVGQRIISRAGNLASEQFQDSDTYQGRRLNRLPQRPVGFCRAFAADRRRVIQAANAAAVSLGRSLTVADIENGIFETAFKDGEHSAAKWMDRYRITVEPLSSGLSGVRVRRQVFISRETRGEIGYVYNEGISAGHGEAWVLTRVTDDLAGRPNVSTIAVDYPR